MSVESPLIDDIRIVGTRFATLTRDDAPFARYKGVPPSVNVLLPVMVVVPLNRIGAAGPINGLFAATAALVDARFTRAPPDAVRDDVARDVVAVRATVPAPDAVRVDVARPAPPVARAAAAFVAAAFVAVRVAAVDVVRDVVEREETEREFAAVRGEEFDVARAATAREEFAADARVDAAPDDAVGIVRPIVVRFVFARVAVPPRVDGTEGIMIFSSTSASASVYSVSKIGFPSASYTTSAYSKSSKTTGATSANAGSTNRLPINTASLFIVKSSFRSVLFYHYTEY